MVANGPLPEFLIKQHYEGWRSRINQLKREFAKGTPIPKISPKVARYGRPNEPMELPLPRAG